MCAVFPSKSEVEASKKIAFAVAERLVENDNQEQTGECRNKAAKQELYHAHVLPTNNGLPAYPRVHHDYQKRSQSKGKRNRLRFNGNALGAIK